MKRPSKLSYQPIIGIIAALLYAVLAGVVANQITHLDIHRSKLEDFALGHFITVPILILIGFLFTKYASWETEVWSTKPPSKTGYRKRWLWIFPILSFIQSIIAFSVVPWSKLNLLFFSTILVGTLLVGIGEEMYFRGILRASLNNFKNELSIILLTGFIFGLAHSFGLLYEGTPMITILFNVCFLAFHGVSLYAMLKATGTLWIPIFLHFLTDFTLYIGSGPEGAIQGSSTIELPPIAGYIGIVSGIASIIFLCAVMKHDRKVRRNSMS